MYDPLKENSNFVRVGSAYRVTERRLRELLNHTSDEKRLMADEILYLRAKLVRLEKERPYGN